MFPEAHAETSSVQTTANHGKRKFGETQPNEKPHSIAPLS